MQKVKIKRINEYTSGIYDKLKPIEVKYLKVIELEKKLI